MPNIKVPWRVGFYQDHRGKSPILDFINDLPAQDRARIDLAIRLLKEFGTNLGMLHARPLRDRIWELRPGGVRLLYFAYINQQFIILHGFRKTAQRTPGREIETAIRRMNEIMEERRMPPIIDYEKWREQQLQDPEFVAELEKLEPGYQVARLRIRLGLTQTQLAEMVGTKQPSIARLENGEGSPSLSFLEKVAEALGADVKVRLIPKTSGHMMSERSKSSDYDTES